MRNAFIERNCEIRGKFGDLVYQRKRNGELMIRQYVYKPKYAPTELSRRSDCITRTAATFTNPQYDGYQSIINKLYYYTPYFVHSGSYSFTCNTFLKLRRKGHYILEINGIKFGRNLAPRSRIELIFDEGHEYQVKCYLGNEIYSEREIYVIDADKEVEDAYAEWFEEHLAEILMLPAPDFVSLYIYRHGLISRGIYGTITGKAGNVVLYCNRRKNFMYVRSSYEHQHSSSGDHYYVSQKQVTACWNAASERFKAVWNKYHWRWLKANFNTSNRLARLHNLWSKAVFRAAHDIGIDPAELSPENWLPGVETLGELLDAASISKYGMTEAELSVRIYSRT